MRVFFIKKQYLENKNFITERELECINLLKENYTAKEIGRILGISNRTVESHFYNIKQKTSAKNKKDILRIFMHQIKNS